MTTTEENRDSLKDEKEAAFKRRKNIVDEILSTEKTYETNLNTIVQSYMVPLRTDDKLSNLLTDDQFKTIFCDIEVILRYTTVFREQLTKRAETFDGNTTKLGDIFIMIADYLKVYTRYVNNYNEAQIVLRGLAEDKKEWVLWLYGRKEVNRLDLTDYLIMPVQRIPRYNLLLQDLVKNTPTEHCDYTDLCKARDRIQEIALFVNEQKRVVENLAQVSEIIASITGLGVKFKLLSPTRRFIRQGELTQTNPEANKKEVFHFFLFNDLLIWCDRKKKSSDKFQFHRLLYLSDMDIRLGFLDGKPGIGLALDDKKVVLLDKTEEGTDVWFNDLVSCRAAILETENKSNIEKRKTFLHEELLQKASTPVKEKDIKKGTIKFKGFFRGSSGDDKKDKEKEKEKEKEKDRQDPRSSKEKNMTINITKDLKMVQLNPLPGNGSAPSTPNANNTPNKVDGPRIRAGTALPNRGSPTMLPTTNNTTPTRPPPQIIVKTEEHTPTTPPVKSSNSDENVAPVKPTNGPPPLPKFNPARALSPPNVMIPKNKGPPPAIPTTAPPATPTVTTSPGNDTNVNKPVPIRRGHSATINVNKASIPGLVPKVLKGQDPTPTPLAALHMPPKAASSPTLDTKAEQNKAPTGGSKSFLAGFASKFNMSNKEKEPVISGPNNVSKAALPPLIAATLAEQEKLREEEQRLRSASAADTSVNELPSPRGGHRRSLSTSH